MEEEHQRYSSMFAGSQQMPKEIERPKSNVTIVEITDEVRMSQFVGLPASLNVSLFCFEVHVFLFLSML